MFLAGPVARGEFKQMTGLGDKTAQGVMSRLLDMGLITSSGHRNPVQLAFPLDTLQFLLPELYPEAATQISP
jgi:chromosome segregation and condensation protein ScpB